MPRTLVPFVALSLAAGCTWFDGARRRRAGQETGIVLDTGVEGGDGVGGGSGSADVPEPDLAPLALGEPGPRGLDPERGLLTWIDLLDGEDDFVGVREQGYTLAYAGVSLAGSRDGPVDADLLARLDAGLDRARAAGIKVVLRFHYTDGADLRDAPVDIVLGHIDALAPVLQAHSDVVAVLQAGFLGAWGEWHSSTSGAFDDPADAAAVVSALLTALPADRMLQVRTPMIKDALVGGPLTAAEAFSGTALSRIGHHNDCLLASDTDYGTYPEGAVDLWRDRVAAESAFVPHGGETCARNPPRTDCESAVAELQLLQSSYLNALYHPDVLAGWQAQGCADAIADGLGPNLVLVAGSMSEAVKPGGLARIELTLENIGWAALFNPRDMEIVLVDEVDTVFLPVPGVELRHLGPGERLQLSLPVRVPFTAAEGARVVSLWLPDPAPLLRNDPRYALRLGNQGAFDSQTGWNVLGTLPVQDGVVGAVDRTAEAWAIEVD